MSNDDGLNDLAEGLNEFATKSPTAPPPANLPQPPARKANQVFSENAPQRPQSGPEAISHEDVSMREFGYEIPVEAVPLPSMGKVYAPGHPLHKATSVSYRSMTAKQEDILLSPSLIKKGTVISELIKSCLVDKRIDVGSLISGDRNALMVAIRMSGYGREYSPGVECPSCGHKNDTVFDLADLDIKTLDIEPVSLGENRFELSLPVSKVKVEFKFLTGAEEEEAIREVSNKKKKGLSNTNIVTTRLMKSIVSVNGNDSGSRIAKFVSVMPARDSLALRKYVDKHEPGVDMDVEFTCEECDYFATITMPMGSKFFWPDN